MRIWIAHYNHGHHSYNIFHIFIESWADSSTIDNQSKIEFICNSFNKQDSVTSPFTLRAEN